MATTNSFVRRELKFVVDSEQHKSLLRAIRRHVNRDSHGDEHGFYHVSSLYFDTTDWKLYYDHLDEVPYRQKLRLRVYDQATLNGSSFLEIKKKYGSVVNKRRLKLPLRAAYEMLYARNTRSSYRDSSVSREAIHLYETLGLSPKAIIVYKRQAFTDNGPDNLRITFDKNIGLSSHTLALECPLTLVPLIARNQMVLEVKTDAAVPLWLSRILSDHACQTQGFSKYTKGVAYIMNNSHTISRRQTYAG